MVGGGGSLGLLKCVMAWQGNKGLCVNLKSQREGIGPRQGRGAQDGVCVWGGDYQVSSASMHLVLESNDRAGHERKLGSRRGSFSRMVG